MKEDETYPLVKKYIENKGLDYMGICNKNKTYIHKATKEKMSVGAEVPVPTVFDAKVYIDHIGDNNSHRLWVECKGSNCGLSKILEGFIRTCYAVYYGGGDGLLCVPHDRIQMIKDNEDYLKQTAQIINGKGRVGILDIEQNKEWFY